MLAGVTFGTRSVICVNYRRRVTLLAPLAKLGVRWSHAGHASYPRLVVGRLTSSTRRAGRVAFIDHPWISALLTLPTDAVRPAAALLALAIDDTLSVRTFGASCPIRAHYVRLPALLTLAACMRVGPGRTLLTFCLIQTRRLSCWTIFARRPRSGYILGLWTDGAHTVG